MSDSCPLTLPSQAQPDTPVLQGLFEGSRCRLAVGSLCSDTRGFLREGRASTSPVLCVWENGTFWNEPLPVSHRWWGNEATLSVMLGFWSKSHRKILLHILPSLDPDEDFKIFLGPKLFLKLLIKCFSENAEADKLIKGKQFFLYQEAQKMNVSLTLSLKTMWIFFSVFETKVTYVIRTMIYYPKNQWDPLSCLVTMVQKSVMENLTKKSSYVGRTWTWVKFLCRLVRGRPKYIFFQLFFSIWSIPM